MIAAENDVDRLAPERAQRAERCIDDACVRARREHTDAADARREESLVEDQEIGRSVPVAHCVMPDEPCLVRRHALYLPLTKKKPASTCASACFVTRPPARSIASNVGSGFNSTSVPARV